MAQIFTMNVLCLGARIIGQELVLELRFAYLGVKCIGDKRHARRMDKIMALENRS